MSTEKVTLTITVKVDVEVATGKITELMTEEWSLERAVDWDGHQITDDDTLDTLAELPLNWSAVLP